VKHQSGVTTVVCIVLLGGCGRRGSTPATSSSQNPPAAGISRASPAETAATNRATSDSAIRAGWMISTAYRISVVGAHDTQVVRFEQLMGRDPRGGAIVRVLDTLVVPPLHSPEVLVGFYCRVHQQPEPAIVAIAVHEDAPVFTRIRRAWRADTLTHRFGKVPLEGIDCHNEGDGA